MSGKLSRKERAQAQRLQQATATSQPQQKKKPAIAIPKANALVRSLNYILIALVAVIYFNSLFNEYALDDYSLILENSQTQQGYKAFFKIFGSSYRDGYMGGDNSLYRPLSKAMFAVEWSMTQGPGINHFVNVILVAFTAVLLFKMLRLYMRGAVLIPFITAAIFTAHPIHTEVIANIKGRDDILSFLFFVVASLYVYRFYVSGKMKQLAFAGGAFFLSLLSKESAITFVAIIPLLLYFFTEADKSKYIRVGGMLLGVSALFLLIRAGVLHGGGIASVPVVDNYIAGIDGFLTQRTTAIAIAGIYVLKLFVPYELVCDASVAQIPVYGVSDWQFLLPFVIFLGAFAFAVMKIKTKHPVAFGILYFFITFSMVANVVFLIGTNYGERLLYAPSLGICLIMGYAMAKLLPGEETSASTVNEFFRVNRKAITVTALIVGSYSFLTIMRNPDWADNDTLYSTDLQKSTNSCKMHYYYANHITQSETLSKLKEGSPEWNHTVDTAIVEFQRAISLYPAYGDAMQKLAEMYLNKKQYDSSEYYYLRAIETSPLMPTYRNNYGRMLFNMGRYFEAEHYFRTAATINPGYSTAWNNLAGCIGMQGAAFVNKGNQYPWHGEEYRQRALQLYQESVEYSLKAIAYDPTFITAYETVAMTYQNMGDAANAQKYSSIAQQLKNSGQGHY